MVKKKHSAMLKLYKQDLRSAAIYSIFLVIISDIYTTVSAFA